MKERPAQGAAEPTGAGCELFATDADDLNAAARLLAGEHLLMASTLRDMALRLAALRQSLASAEARLDFLDRPEAGTGTDVRLLNADELAIYDSLLVQCRIPDRDKTPDERRRDLAQAGMAFGVMLPEVHRLRAHIATLTRQLAEAQQDAERYRYLLSIDALGRQLRARDGLMQLHFGEEWNKIVMPTSRVGGMTRDLVNEAIDSARAALSPSPSEVL